MLHGGPFLRQLTSNVVNYACHKAHDLASISAYHIGLLSIALEQAKKASEMSPDDLRLSGNVVYIQDKISGSQVGYDGPPDAV